uniref:Uncharacterized protein n=1 Tax=Anguilla anguilla TaxID=7936 RepID=A0A0E9XKK5_ANGAN
MRLGDEGLTLRTWVA